MRFTTMLCRAGLIGVGLTVLTCAGSAQAPASQPGIEIASVKPNHSGLITWGIGYQNGRFTASNATLFAMIASAYGPLAGQQIVGGPSWIAVDRFDVEASVTGEPAGDADGALRRMFPILQALLADRFSLVVHHETRNLPTYALRRASDGQLGPGLRPATADCTALRAAYDAQVKRRPCTIGGSSGSLIGDASTLSQLATALSNWVGRLVVNDTSLQGQFDFELTWTPDQASSSGRDDGPAIVTALREQLGLRLEPSRSEPVDVLVIDHVERPTED